MQLTLLLFLVGGGGILTLVSDFVIAAAEELDKPDAVTEGISHLRDATPIMRSNFALHRGSCIDRSADCGGNIRNHEVEMDRRPVSAVAAHVVCICLRLRLVRLQQQIDGRRDSEHFHREGAEPPPDLQTKRPLVERDPLRQVIDIHVDEQIHCLLRNRCLGANDNQPANLLPWAVSRRPASC